VDVGSVIDFLLLSPTAVGRLEVGEMHMQFYLAPELHVAFFVRRGRSSDSPLPNCWNACDADMYACESVVWRHVCAFYVGGDIYIYIYIEKE